MNVDIRWEGDRRDAEASQLLTEISEVLAKDQDIEATAERVEAAPGTKDPITTIGLIFSGVGTAVSVISAVVSVMSYIRSTRPTVKITVTRGEKKVEVTGEADDVQNAIEALEESDDDVRVRLDDASA